MGGAGPEAHLLLRSFSSSLGLPRGKSSFASSRLSPSQTADMQRSTSTARTIRPTAFRPPEWVIVLVSLCLGSVLFETSTLRAQDPPNGPAHIQQVHQSETVPQWIKEAEAPEGALLQAFLENNQGFGISVFSKGGQGTSSPSTILQKGASNTAEIRQQGANNVASVLQVGSFNTTTIAQQGDRNAAGVSLKGSHNAVELFQQGDNNRYLFHFSGSHLDKTGPNRLEQIGDGNTMVEVGENSIPFNIRQRGDGMRMIIRHEAPQ